MARAFRDALGVRPLRLPRACWRLHEQPSDPQSSGLYKAVTDASIGRSVRLRAICGSRSAS
jgi:hypothetical protein